MKLFGSFKVTDRIRVGASSGGRKKKSSSFGCGTFFILLVLICAPIGMIKSCVAGDEPDTTTEPITIVEEIDETASTEETTEQETTTEETTTEKETTTKKESTTKEKTTAAPTTARKETTTKKPTTTAKPVVEKREYVLNTNTKKIHNPGCSSVEDIQPENYDKTKDFDGAIADGYSPCGRCHPTGN
jgi:cytoskeletal protein RodZ